MAVASLYPISDHCDGFRFFNPQNHVNRTWLDVLKWRRTSKGKPWPKQVEIKTAQNLPPLGDALLACTWINHASFLMRFPKVNVLIDPIYSECAGPFGRLGPKRVHPPGIRFADLPRIDVVLLSHDHYDHCDLPTLRRLAAEHSPIAITPLGNGQLLRRAGFPTDRIIELDWWQSWAHAELDITLTTARHWSNRLSGPRNGRLWGGFYLNSSKRRVAYTGDTGYDSDYFTEVQRRLGAPDLALIPIGAYEPRWFMAPQHCNPAEAVQIHRDLSAGKSVAMHWGTFQLTDEGREDPLVGLAAALAGQAIPKNQFQAIEPGETLNI
jgi:L-ascorbate metabolism protein UlaG (beta-lactamase superfamily)|uniref:MBL fold metallo-hydrolase n=1 Tax=Cephaloticoccus sp. TaxID=1985742 RepID=UPI00404AD17A